MPTTETQLRKAVEKALRQAYPGCWVFNVHGSAYQMAGVPDLLVCYRGLLVGIELKHQKPGESEQHARDRATPQQRKQISDLQAAGATAGVALTVFEALALMEEAVTGHRP